MSSQPPIDKRKSSEQAWAKPTERLQVDADMPQGAMNLNVQGRQLTNPLQGFGQMWQKTYRIKLIAPRVHATGKAASPQDIIAGWKANFAKFWPRGNNFYAPLTEVTPGQVAVLNLKGPGGIPLSTGIRVIYADDEQFSFMTPQGHMFAGMITFSSEQVREDVYAQVQALIRASDPAYELFFKLGIIGKMEDQFWTATLENLASYFGASGKVEIKSQLVDSRWNWGSAKNIWHNAAMWSGIYTVTTPLRWLTGSGKSSGGKSK
jgi:hypothetical protein